MDDRRCPNFEPKDSEEHSEFVRRFQKLTRKFKKEIAELTDPSSEAKGFFIAGGLVHDEFPHGVQATTFLMGHNVSDSSVHSMLLELIEKSGERTTITGAIEQGQMMTGFDGSGSIRGFIAGVLAQVTKDVPAEAVTKGLVKRVALEYIEGNKGAPLIGDEIEQMNTVLEVMYKQIDTVEEDEAVDYLIGELDMMDRESNKLGPMVKEARDLPIEMFITAAQEIARKLGLETISFMEVAHRMQMQLGSSEDLR